jgi:hypothetical protein
VGEEGDGLAVAGLAMGYLMTILVVALVAAGVAMVAAVIGSGTSR